MAADCAGCAAWARELVPQLEALVARYSKLGGDAFYRYYLPVDEMFSQAASAELTPEMSVFHGRK